MMLCVCGLNICECCGRNFDFGGAFLADSRTGWLVLLWIVQEPFVIVASCGAGQWLALKASRITCWSRRLTGMSVVSPGINIVLFLMWMRGGGFVVLCVPYCTVLSCVFTVLLPFILFTVLYYGL